MSMNGESIPLTGRMVGPYSIGEQLGRGGMGVVYRAIDQRLSRPVALKLIAPHLTGDAKAIARFTQEARAASALDHPSVGVVLDIGEHEGTPYIVMPLYEGEALDAMIARGPIKPAE